MTGPVYQADLYTWRVIGRGVDEQVRQSQVI